MKNKIGYLTFGRDDFGYGLSLVLSRLSGFYVYRVSPKTANYVDYLLFSCFWWEHIYLLADFLRNAGIKKENTDRPEIIIGGFNTYNPVPFLDYADKVFVGDGESALVDYLNRKNIESIYIGQKSVEYKTESTLSAHCHVTNDIARMEVARGCKFKCKFCLVSHIKKYREVPFDQIEEKLKGIKQKRVSCFAPEPHLHKKESDIQALCDRLGKSRMDTDVRLENLNRRVHSVIPRFGMEGMSERLRYAVGKKYSDDFIIETFEKAIKTGLKAVTFYLILDLPGEDDEDWLALDNLLGRVGKIKGSDNFTLFPFPNTFNPNPHTPLAFNGINFDRDYYKLWQKMFCWDGNRGAEGRGGKEKGNPWGVKVVAKSRIPVPASRILSMISIRAGSEFFEIEKELTEKKILKIKSGRPSCSDLDGLVRVLGNYGGVDRYCGPLDPDGDHPWKVVKL